ncbi:phosphoglycerate mutase family protein, partial [archaeon]
MHFIVVRHSERIDEADKEEWKTHYNELYHHSPCPVQRSKKYYMNDPPITDRGRVYAEQAAHTVSKLVSRLATPSFSLPTHTPTHALVRIYSSKMKRCVQTAVYVARMLREGGMGGLDEGKEGDGDGKSRDGDRLYAKGGGVCAGADGVCGDSTGVCLYLTSGLSSVIKAVNMASGAFEFMAPAELDSICDGITYIDCDVPHTPYTLPCDDYVHTIHALLDRPIPSHTHTLSVVNILVGHRETIRG